MSSYQIKGRFPREDETDSRGCVLVWQNYDERWRLMHRDSVMLGDTWKPVPSPVPDKPYDRDTSLAASECIVRDWMENGGDDDLDSVVMPAFNRIISAAKERDGLVSSNKILRAKVAAMESIRDKLLKAMRESCRDDRSEVMGGCVLASEMKDRIAELEAERDELAEKVDALDKAVQRLLSQRDRARHERDQRAARIAELEYKLIPSAKLEPMDAHDTPSENKPPTLEDVPDGNLCVVKTGVANCRMYGAEARLKWKPHWTWGFISSEQDDSTPSESERREWWILKTDSTCDLAYRDSSEVAYYENVGRPLIHVIAAHVH